jgi:hypothetical protein
VPQLKNNFELKDFIYSWNKKYPFDFIWRKKYNISFNSPQHRAMSLIDIKIDLLETQIINESLEIVKQRKDNYENYKITGKWLNNKPDKPLSDEEFYNIKL